MRATQIAAVEHRALVYMSVQAACLAGLLFMLDQREPTRPAAPAAAARVAAERGAADAAAVTVAIRPELGFGPIRIAVVERGQVERVVAGGLRGEVTANGVALADDRFASWIVGVVRARSSWLFLAADGAVARADSFLGPLESLGYVPGIAEGTLAALTASQGRLAILTRDPHAMLWTTDGSAPVAAVRGLPPGIVMSAAFADAEHGMIVVEGGAVFATRDAARSFARVDLGDTAAATVAAMDGALYVTTSEGVAIFERDGVLRRGPGPVQAVPGPALPAVFGVEDEADARVHRQVFTAVVQRYGALVVEALYGAIAGNGRPVVAVDHGLAALDGSPSALDLTQLEHGHACRVSRWGDDLALICLDGLFRADAKTLRATKVTAESGFQDVAVSSDGVHAAWECEQGRASLCLLDGSRVIRRPHRSDRLLGLHGDAAVVLRPQRERAALVLIDAATGAERRSVALPRAPAGTELAGAWQMTADGAAVIATARAAATTGQAAGESWLVRVGLPDGAVTTGRLPRGAIRAGFASAERGVAAGEDASTLWLTTDGGAHWQARHAVSGVNRSIACSAGRCVVDDLVVVSFDWPIARAADRVIAAPVQAAAPPAPSRGPGLACKAVDAAQPAPDRNELCRGELDARGRLRFREPNVDVTLAVAPDGRWTAAWHGRDWRGPYPTRVAAGMMAPPGETGWLQPARATREGVVISQVGDAQRLVWMPAGGHAAQIGDPDLPAAALDDLLTLPGGELAVLLRFKASGQPDRDYYRLQVVGPGGAIRAHRTYAWDWGRNAAVGFLDGTAGVQWAESDPARPRWFVSIDAAAPSRALAALDVAATPVCRTPPGAAGRLSIRIEGPELQDWPADQGKSIARLYWRDGERPCLQAIEARQLLLGGRDVFVAASPRGDLRTVLDLPDVQKVRSLRCGLELAGDAESRGPGFGETWGAWKAGEVCSSGAPP
jgi:hypothetical protein